MSETITKLQPNRTLFIGFNSAGCAVSLNNTSATGATVSGTFLAADDFAIMEWERDNAFEHLDCRFLPDGNFTGLILSYDFAHTNLQDIASGLYNFTDYPYLVITSGFPETIYKIPLKNYAVAKAGDSSLPASASITLSGTMTAGDRVIVAVGRSNYVYTVLGSETLYDIVYALAYDINIDGNAWVTAVQSAETLILTTIETGNDTNLLWGYCRVRGTSPTESWSAANFQFTGGHSPAWTVTLPFNSLVDMNSVPVPVTNIRKIQWFFGPQMLLANPTVQEPNDTRQEFSAVFSNWALTGTGVTSLNRLYPQLRSEWEYPTVISSGTWQESQSWQASQNQYMASNATGSNRKIAYTYPVAHDLWFSGICDPSSGIASVSIDGSTAFNLDLYSGGVETYNALIKLASSLAAGSHTVLITVSGTKNSASGGYWLNLDCLMAGNQATWNPPAVSRTDVGFCTDYDYGNARVLSPERLVWGITQSGLIGQLNHYVGAGLVWPQRKRVNGTTPSITVTLTGTVTNGDAVYIGFPNILEGRPVLSDDLLSDLSLGLANIINYRYAGIWAWVVGSVVHVKCRCTSYSFTVATSVTGAATEVLTASGNLGSGVYGYWEIDPTVTPELNRAARDTHAALVAALVAAGMTGVFALSSELYQCPVSMGQYFNDGQIVTTATPSYMSNFSTATVDYIAEALLELAQAQVAGGMQPLVQMGEYQWWYGTSDNNGAHGSMPYYDTDTKAAFLAAYGRALYVFTSNATNPDSVNGGVDANWLQARLAAASAAVRAYVLASVASCIFEVLWPMDSNDPLPLASPSRPLDLRVNMPTSEWNSANLASFKIEGFAYQGPPGLQGPNSDSVKAMIVYPINTLGFPLSKTKVLLASYDPTFNYDRNVAFCSEQHIPLTLIWGYDSFVSTSLSLRNMMNIDAPDS
jgi:hypothetical protein